MDAPFYPAAIRYSTPRFLPYRLSLHGSSIGELRAHPDAWAMVCRAIPYAPMLVAMPQLQPHLGNMSFPAIADASGAPLQDLEQLDKALQMLGEVE